MNLLTHRALPYDRVSVMRTAGRSSCGRVSLRATGAKGQGDRETGTETIGPDPGVLGRAHSGNHCYTFAPGQERGARLGCPKSAISANEK